MFRVPIPLVLALALATTAVAQTPAAEAEVDLRPGWLEKPSSALLYWPAGAGSREEATVIVVCRIELTGVPTDCVASEETPPGRGFGQAAVVYAQRGRFTPAIKDGHPVVSTVRIPIKFPDRGIAPATANDIRRKIRLIDQPRWVQEPTAAEIAAATPHSLVATGAVGTVTLVCNTREDHTLSVCKPEAEFPRGRGLTNAARKLARAYRLAPGSIAPGKAGTDTRVRVRFTFGGDPTASPAR